MIICDSCGTNICGLADDVRCRGCNFYVCQYCCDMFDHYGNGLHGKGNPREAVVALQKQLNECYDAI